MVRPKAGESNDPIWDREQFMALLDELKFLWERSAPRGARASQNEWARALGMDAQLLSGWKTGRYRPGWDNVRDMANAVLLVYQKIAGTAGALAGAPGGLRDRFPIGHPHPEQLPVWVYCYKALWRYAGYLEPLPADPKAREIYDAYLSGGAEFQKYLFEVYQNATDDWSARMKAAGKPAVG